MYTHAARFDSNPEKSAANLIDRGFDFEFAALIFEGPTLERRDDRRDYGEVRIVATGLAQGIHLTVVYTDRRDKQGPFRRIVSARRSKRRERKIYDQQVRPS